MENPMSDILDEGLNHIVHKWEHYLPLYHKHFKQYRNDASPKNKIKLLEIGIFMGGSLDLWNAYFGSENCEIYGVDINPDCKQFENDNIKILIGDQDDEMFLDSIVNTTGPFDIIIDDGGHRMHQQIISLEKLFSHVKPGGIYLCEDIHTSYWPAYGGGNHKGTFIEYSKRLIDKINAYHHSFTPVDSFTQSCSAIHYYDSMIFLEKSTSPIKNPIDKIWHPKHSSPVKEMSELKTHDTSIFKDEHGNTINHHVVERSEQIDAYLFLPRDSTVLELGARYGTVSCLISRLLKDPRSHLAVEPARCVINALTQNRIKSGARFEIWSGAVSNRPLQLSGSGYGDVTKHVEGSGNIQVATLSELEQKYGLKFDALVADCEGCICNFVKENDISNFRIILLEKDYVTNTNYEEIDKSLYDVGFVKIKEEFNEVYRTVYVNTTSIGFKILDHTVGHGHLGLFGRIGYETDKGTDVLLTNGWTAISAHGPSKIILQIDRQMTIRGYLLPSAVSDNKYTFSCDENAVGIINRASETTTDISVQPGIHTLTVDGINSWAHTVWLLK